MKYLHKESVFETTSTKNMHRSIPKVLMQFGSIQNIFVSVPSCPNIPIFIKWGLDDVSKVQLFRRNLKSIQKSTTIKVFCWTNTKWRPISKVGFDCNTIVITSFSCCFQDCHPINFSCGSEPLYISDTKKKINSYLQ